MKNIADKFLPVLNKEPTNFTLPAILPSNNIPKIIHQTFYTRDLPPEFQTNVDQLRAANPEWEYRFYDDADIDSFIQEHYGAEILSYYNRINPRYGAARADLFRYLLIYKVGGVYLDIKSTFTKPINEVICDGDTFLLSGWQNRKGENREGFGLPKELNHLEGGEYQQWHVIGAPGHPFLRAVILNVLTNIDKYRPWLHGTGGNGVLRTTGPIAYTLAIEPLRKQHAHKYFRTDCEAGLLYANLNNRSHKPLIKNHYMQHTESVIEMKGFQKYLGQAYSALKALKKMGRRELLAKILHKSFVRPVMPLSIGPVAVLGCLIMLF